jgi:3-hydroxyacyl-[acyl-carrier-protein] dehydratase
MEPGSIKQCIPHRAPFLLVDQVSDYELGKSIVASFNVVAELPVFEGHFPQSPIFPGVMIVEGIAQAGAILGRLSFSDKTGCLLTEVENARFKRQVLPGDVLRYEVNLVKQRAAFIWFEGCAYVGNELAAKVKYSARIG